MKDYKHIWQLNKDVRPLMDCCTIKCEVVGLFEQHSMLVNGLKSKATHVFSPHKNVNYHPCIQNKNMQVHTYSIISHLYLKHTKLNEWIGTFQKIYNPS
jgi:hypothetical protein